MSFTDNTAEVSVIGAGLAGSEAAWKLGRAGVRARLIEMRPARSTAAHRTGLFAELVCSNSLKSESVHNASGLLKAEMEILDSLLIRVARHCRVPAGQALAVDREGFARRVTEEIEDLDMIEIGREEACGLPDSGLVIVATGPLTSENLARELAGLAGAEHLAFYDAIAPIVTVDSIDMSVAFRASRYDKGGADYINCPFNEEEYNRFMDALLLARRAPLRDFEDPRFFEGCLPIEVMAERGRETLAHGPLKPVGLVDPRAGRRPYAVLQLRQDNADGTLYNMVGFQTRLARPEQERVFRLIPGLARAEFARLGSVHRNTFINSPALLNPDLSLRKDPRLFIAGQLSGVEGYMESAAMGIMAGINVALKVMGKDSVTPPRTTITGALMHYISDPGRIDFQPMNANFGIIEPLAGRARKAARKEAMSGRALEDMKNFAESIKHLFNRE